MDILTNTYKYNPNEMVHTLYGGVGPGHTTMTKVVKASKDRNRLEATTIYEKGIPRGVGGRVGVFVLGGMETTMDEMRYILEAKQAKKFVPRNGPGDIARMCKLLAERRNDEIMAQRQYLKKNPSERPKKRTVRLHLPVGVRMVDTAVPGFKLTVRG